MWVSVFGTHIINSLLKEVENMSEQKITKDMIIADIIKVDENLIPVLLNAGMHCVGCPSSLGGSRGSWNRC